MPGMELPFRKLHLSNTTLSTATTLKHHSLNNNQFSNHQTANMQYTIATLFALIPLVAAHGQMLSPLVRTSSAFGSNDYLRSPLNLRAPLFTNGASMEPCGGVSRGESQTSATSVSPGQTLSINWEMGFWTGAALHQGNIQIQISADGSEGNWETLKTVDLTGKSTVDDTPHGTEVTLPSSLGSNPVLRWYWDATLTGEKYINCADLTTNGGGSPGNDSGNSNNAASDGNKNNEADSSSDSNTNVNFSNNNGSSSSGQDSSSGCQPQWAQCGGVAWSGSTCCQGGSQCKYDNEWYSQCQ